MDYSHKEYITLQITILRYAYNRVGYRKERIVGRFKQVFS